MKLKTTLKIVLLLISSIAIKFVLSDHLLKLESIPVEIITIFAILVFGGFVIYSITNYIEDITGMLKDKTGIAGGLLQALGTAFPDMSLGIIAAIISLSYVGTNRLLAIQYAIVAASTTFGSNIYNIGHAAWCIYRQNQANTKNKNIKMFPVFGGGTVQPLQSHHIKPKVIEINTALSVLSALTLLTTFVVLSMVFFGRVEAPAGITGDLYQLKWFIGLIMIGLIVFTLYIFRKNYGSHQEDDSNPFINSKTITLWLVLAVSGIIILFSAEAMIHAVIKFSEITGIPTVISGLMAGLIGCLGEMLVIHNFTVNPKGRIGDAVVGVAMDNIVTLFGASVIAVLGGIFLGGSSLLVIFIIILSLNSILIWQVSKLKDEYLASEHRR